MWKLLHKIFGWDYISWQNHADQGVARVYRGGNGEVYFWRYKSTTLADQIRSPGEVLWLTCPASKYLP